MRATKSSFRVPAILVGNDTAPSSQNRLGSYAKPGGGAGVAAGRVRPCGVVDDGRRLCGVSITSERMSSDLGCERVFRGLVPTSACGPALPHRRWRTAPLRPPAPLAVGRAVSLCQCPYCRPTRRLQSAGERASQGATRGDIRTTACSCGSAYRLASARRISVRGSVSMVPPVVRLGCAAAHLLVLAARETPRLGPLVERPPVHPVVRDARRARALLGRLGHR